MYLAMTVILAAALVVPGESELKVRISGVIAKSAAHYRALDAAATPFPEIVKTSPDRKENLSRRVKTIDGKERETMYVDYFVLRPGAKGEVRATAMDGSPICIRGDCGMGKVFFNGTVGVESVNGTYDTRSARLNGFNADMAREAVEYFTGITLVPKASSSR